MPGADESPGHLAVVEGEYLGLVFDRPFDDPILAALDLDADPNADLWATEDESREDIVALYRRAWGHADTTIEALDLDATGRVPWWPPDHDGVTLHRILVHVATETHRHAGHADLVRELIDGTAGLRPGGDNLAYHDAEQWRTYHDHLEAVARRVADPPR